MFLSRFTMIPFFFQFQADEIEALSAIYGDEWCVIDEESRIFCIRVSDSTESPKWSLSLQVCYVIIKHF
jgi:hypothetical protein